MNGINIGSIVSINDDFYEAVRYEILKIETEKAKLRSINPQEYVFWEDLSNLTLSTMTKEEVIEEWRKHHDYSGI